MLRLLRAFDSKNDIPAARNGVAAHDASMMTIPAVFSGTPRKMPHPMDAPKTACVMGSGRRTAVAISIIARVTPSMSSSDALGSSPMSVLPWIAPVSLFPSRSAPSASPATNMSMPYL